MDTNKVEPVIDATNIEASGWKSREHRNMTMKRIADFLMKHGPPSWTQNFPALVKSVERFEEKVFASAKDEAEYNARISVKLNTIKAIQSSKSNVSPSIPTGSGADNEMNIEWQEQVYQKVQTITNTYFTKLDSIYKNICSKLQQHEFVTQQPNTTDVEKCEYHKRVLEYIFGLLKVQKSDITPEINQKVEKAEKYIQSILRRRNVSSSHHQEEDSANVQSMQQFVPSHLTISDQPQENIQVSIQQDFSDENVVQQETSGEAKSPEVFVINNNNPENISTPVPLLEDCRDVNDSVIVDDTSAAMQHLVTVLSSMSTEALVAASCEIGVVVHLNDDSSKLEPLINGPDSAIGTNLEGVAVTNTQARYLTHKAFASKERKMRRFIRSKPATSRSIVELTSEQKTYSNSASTQENHNLSKEIEEINKRLIDTEVVIDEGKAFPGAAEQGEGLIVKLLFHSITVNVNPMCEYSYKKKSIIKPLWLHVPSSYPYCSPVIIDEMSSEISNVDFPEDLTVKAKVKLRHFLLSQSQPLSLKDIATSWDRYVREAICEYAQFQGGGTFSSKYGGWENV